MANIPPDQKADVDDKMYNELNNIVSRNQNTVILGDFNLTNINWENLDVHSYYNNRNQSDHRSRETPSEKLLTIIQENFLTQNVHEPTRGQNILDLVITTNKNLLGEHIATTDQNLIRGKIKIPKELGENNEQIFNYKKGKFNKIKDKLRRINWTTLFQDKSVSNMYDTFSSHLMELVDEHVPKQIRCKSGRPSPK